MPNTWIVVRIDGRGFTKYDFLDLLCILLHIIFCEDLTPPRLCTKYDFAKPNDKKALDLMNNAAKAIMTELPDIAVGYGVSDEYSFVFHKTCTLFDRRASKLVSTIVSSFTAYYVHLWTSHFPEDPLTPPLPSFDGRAVCYPSVQNLRDYMSWRQVDCHINNLFNTTFWALVQLGGQDTKEAEKALAGTFAKDKNEILFSQFGINYNNEPEMFKKGSVAYRDYELVEPGGQNLEKEVDDIAEPVVQSKTQAEKDRKKRGKAMVVVEHLDIIKDDFWERRPWLLSGKPGKIPKQV
ncbi:hypothetical protein MKZ38_007847 [Zalerion maritima]|uniref:tRNA(His) guanylyltransferase n=1 Tax=Zalerion maritima TaxID=339359 RepID=A0AAD5RUJ1_9PEZI|nr:hypothetical protein MKZ38_007847 [Zalerion maritima]